MVVNLWSNQEKYSEEAAVRYSSFIGHEVVHLWLNEVANNKDENTQIWLHEGAAEYISDRIVLNPDAFSEVASAQLEICLSNIGGRPLDGSVGTIFGDVAYSCGFVVQLAAELSAMKVDILDIWQKIITDSDVLSYGKDIFVSVASHMGRENFSDFSSIMLEQQGYPKIYSLMEKLFKMGITIESGNAEPSYGDVLLRPALLKLLDSKCTGRRGWYPGSDHFELVSGDRFGPVLSGDPLISTIGGHSVIKAPYLAFLAIKEACNEGEMLTFGDNKDSDLGTVKCDVEIAEPGPISTLNIPLIAKLK